MTYAACHCFDFCDEACQCYQWGHFDKDCPFYEDETGRERYVEGK